MYVITLGPTQKFKAHFFKTQLKIVYSKIQTSTYICFKIIIFYIHTHITKYPWTSCFCVIPIFVLSCRENTIVANLLRSQ